MGLRTFTGVYPFAFLIQHLIYPKLSCAIQLAKAFRHVSASAFSGVGDVMLDDCARRIAWSAVLLCLPPRFPSEGRRKILTME